MTIDPATKESKGVSNDVWVTRLTVAGLFNTVFLAIGGIIICQFNGREIPQSLSAIASTALGVIAGILIQNPSSGNRN